MGQLFIYLPLRGEGLGEGEIVFKCLIPNLEISPLTMPGGSSVVSGYRIRVESQRYTPMLLRHGSSSVLLQSALHCDGQASAHSPVP